MKKAACTALLAGLAALTLAASALGTESAARPFRIVGTSHSHPEGKTFSYVCVKVKKTTTRKATVTVTGAGAAYPGERYTRTIRGRGTKLVVFRIVAPGPFTFRVKQGTKKATASYTVPAPDPPNGPFRCV